MDSRRDMVMIEFSLMFVWKCLAYVSFFLFFKFRSFFFLFFKYNRMIGMLCYVFWVLVYRFLRFVF